MSNPTTPRIILDTDPGIDDAIAIITAARWSEIVGITTVAGNVPVDHTTVNALKISELIGLDVPIHKGANEPLVSEPLHARHVHGTTGLGEVNLPEPKKGPDSEDAVSFLIETTREEEGLHLVPIGPLTNIALALDKDPEIVNRVASITLMGGGVGIGNVTAAAEFNIFVDPHAADIVFRCGRPITVMPLDTTHQVITNKKITEKIGKIGNRVGEIVKSMLEFYNRFDKKKYGTDGGPLHDPCTIAYLLEPKIFVGKKVNLTVELQSKLTLGSTSVDFWSVTDRPKNVNWIYEVNSDLFFRLLIDKLSLLP